MSTCGDCARGRLDRTGRWVGCPRHHATYYAQKPACKKGFKAKPQVVEEKKE